MKCNPRPYNHFLLKSKANKKSFSNNQARKFKNIQCIDCTFTYGLDKSLQDFRKHLLCIHKGLIHWRHTHHYTVYRHNLKSKKRSLPRAKGSFTFYVDRNLGFFDPSLPPCRQFIYWGLFTRLDIWKTPPSLSSVYVDCERPLIIGSNIIWIIQKWWKNDIQLIVLKNW